MPCVISPQGVVAPHEFQELFRAESDFTHMLPPRDVEYQTRSSVISQPPFSAGGDHSMDVQLMPTQLAKRPARYPNLGPSTKRSRPISSASTSASSGADVSDVASDSESLPDAHDARGDIPQRIHASFERLRLVLKSVAANERREAISNLPPAVSKKFLAFMEMRRHGATSDCNEHNAVHGAHSASARFAPWLRDIVIRACRNIHSTRYVAQLRIRHLRIYTCVQITREGATGHCAVFAQLRKAVAAAGDEVWDEPAAFSQLFRDACKGHSVSESDFRVFVYMRADEWVGRRRTVASPVMPLAEAVAVHARLLHSRAESWELLRAEWAPLLQRTRQGRDARMSLADATALLEKARRSFLKERLARFTQEAVDLNRRAAARVLSAAKRLRQASMLAASKTVVTEGIQRRLQLRRLTRLRAERWRWFRSDLTTDEILQGIPPHLRLD